MDIATALPPEIFDPVRLRAELGEPQGDAAPVGERADRPHAASLPRGPGARPRALRGRRRGRGGPPRADAADGRADPGRPRLRRGPRLRHVEPEHRRGAGGGGGRRLRPRRAGAAVRRRPPVPAPLQAHAARRADGGVPALPPLRPRPHGRPLGALGGRVREARQGRPHGPHRTPRDPLRLGLPGALRGVRARLPGRGRGGQRPGLHRGQARRARRPAREARRLALPARAQHQGGQGRPARPAHADVDRPLPLRRAGAGRAGPPRRPHPPVARDLHPLAPLPVDGALPPPLPRRPGGGAADLRPAARDRPAHGLPRPLHAARGRALHEALLPGGAATWAL